MAPEELLLSIILALSPSHLCPTSLFGIDSILRWVLPPRWQMATNRARLTPLRTPTGQQRSPFLVNPAEGLGEFWLVLEGINHYGQNMRHYDRPAWNTHKTSEPRLNCIQTPGLRLGKGGSLQQWACWFQTAGIILGKEPNVCSLNHFLLSFGESISY